MYNDKITRSERTGKSEADKWIDKNGWIALLALFVLGGIIAGK